MHYRDFACPSTSLLAERPNNTVLLHVRKGEMLKLQALIRALDVRLYGPIRRMPTGTAFLDVVCRDAATASALQAAWSASS